MNRDYVTGSSYGEMSLYDAAEILRQQCLRANMSPSMVEAICQYIRNGDQESSEEVNRYLRDAIRNAFANSLELASEEPEEMETENSEELDSFLNTFALKEVC